MYSYAFYYGRISNLFNCHRFSIYLKRVMKILLSNLYSYLYKYFLDLHLSQMLDWKCNSQAFYYIMLYNIHVRDFKKYFMKKYLTFKNRNIQQMSEASEEKSLQIYYLFFSFTSKLFFLLFWLRWNLTSCSSGNPLSVYLSHIGKQKRYALLIDWSCYIFKCMQSWE